MYMLINGAIENWMSPYLGQSFREKRRALKAQFIDSNQGPEHSNMRLKNKLSRNKDWFNSKDTMVRNHYCTYAVELGDKELFGHPKTVP